MAWGTPEIQRFMKVVVPSVIVSSLIVLAGTGCDRPTKTVDATATTLPPAGQPALTATTTEVPTAVPTATSTPRPTTEVQIGGGAGGVAPTAEVKPTFAPTKTESPFGPDGTTAKYPLIFENQLEKPFMGDANITLPTDKKGVVQTGIFIQVTDPVDKFNYNIVSAIVAGKQENSLLPLVVYVDRKPIKIFLKTNETLPGNSQVLEQAFVTTPNNTYDGTATMTPPHQAMEKKIANQNLAIGAQIIVELNGAYPKPLVCPDPSRCAYMNYLSNTFGAENDKLGNGSQKLTENQVLHFPYLVFVATNNGK